VPSEKRDHNGTQLGQRSSAFQFELAFKYLSTFKYRWREKSFSSSLKNLFPSNFRVSRFSFSSSSSFSHGRQAHPHALRPPRSEFSPPNPSLSLPARSCAHELNALFSANAHNFPSIVVRSRTTFTRAETAAVAAKIASSPAADWAAGVGGGVGGAGQQQQQQQRSQQHLVLAAHILSVAFAPFPTAALSVYEIEAPGWLAGWASRWCSAAAPATPRLGSPSPSPSPSQAASSSGSLSSYDSDENGASPSVGTVVKLMALHGYAEGQPACGQGAGIGEPQKTGSGGRPARTVFLRIW
jgi:hypothetical protein